MNRTIATKALTLTLMAGALAACTTVGPNYKLPDNAIVKRADANAPFVGASDKAFQSAPLPADWWRLYNDPLLDQLIAKAFAANTDLRVAAGNLERIRVALEEVEEKKRPDIDATVAPQYGRIAGASLGIPEVLPRTGLYDADIRISWQTDMWGRIRRAIEGAEADQEAMQAASDMAHVSVAADTTRAYVDACTAGYQLKVAQSSLDLQDKFVKLTGERIRRGRGTALESSRAAAQYEQLRANLPPLEARRRVALYRLAVLTGDVPSQFPQAVAACATPPRVAAVIPVGDGAALLRRRPDVRQAERQLASATARIGVATAELYPNISLGASFGSVGMMSQFNDANTWKFSMGPLIQWSLPGSTARLHIKEAQIGTDVQLARFDGVVLNALRETESALTVYARELDRNAALKGARDQSALAARQSARLYDFGRTDFLSQLDADRTLAVAETQLAVSDAQLASDQVQLFLALGGGWENTHAEVKEAHAK
jgi:NodT family efflux transporter outer membrane factor (OMF) lipoprotein